MIAFSTTRGFWKPDEISANEHYRVSPSPFAVLLAALREPLLGHLPAASTGAGWSGLQRADGEEQEVEAVPEVQSLRNIAIRKIPVRLGLGAD